MAISDDAIAALVATITAKFGTAAGNLAGAYIPTLYTMSVTQLAAITDLLAANKTTAAQAAIEAAMTPEQLATQKDTLATLTAQMASDNAASNAFWNNMVSACLKLALTALIPSVTL